jgi:hypothetical protein
VELWLSRCVILMEAVSLLTIATSKKLKLKDQLANNEVFGVYGAMYGTPSV